MIYVNSRVNKKYIQLRDIKLSFEECGVYVLKGENGCGKTTLIESIVFDENKSHFLFSDKREKNAFITNKHNLFTYIPQKITYSEMRVDTYIKKMNSKVKEEEILYYLQRFSLPIDILKSKYCFLSGGEQKKISIIAALIKNTPYIFMDEPTNYMDDSSVSTLINVLESEARKKKIIIVTHDTRLYIKEQRKFILSNGTIEKISVDTLANERNCCVCQIPENSKPNMLKLFWGVTKEFSFRITYIIVTLILANLLFFTNLSFGDSIGETVGIYHDTILIYYTGGGHDSLNEMYEKSENIKVDMSIYEKYIDYAEIPIIANINNINDIYIPDCVYIHEVAEKITNAQTDDVILYSCPNKYIEQYVDTFGDEFCITYTEGSIPKDGKSEVAISKTLLLKHFGYTEDTVDDAIGDSITIDNFDYEIVGFSYYDIAIISYDKSTNYGYYHYDEDTYDEFYDKQMAYINEIDGDDAVNNILINVDEENEKTVLNNLISNYPADCYISKYFEDSFYKQQKFEVFRKWLVINCIIAIIFSVIIWFVVHKSIKYNLNVIFDIGNYYVNRKSIMKSYIGIQGAQYLLIGIVVILINSIFSSFSYMTNYYILIDCLILIIPIMIACKQGLIEVTS